MVVVVVVASENNARSVQIVSACSKSILSGAPSTKLLFRVSRQIWWSEPTGTKFDRLNG